MNVEFGFLACMVLLASPIIDEIHAYDAYMSRPSIVRLLRWCAVPEGSREFSLRDSVCRPAKAMTLAYVPEQACGGRSSRCRPVSAHHVAEPVCLSHSLRAEASSTRRLL